MNMRLAACGSKGMYPTSSTTSSGMRCSLSSSVSRRPWRWASPRRAIHSVAVRTRRGGRRGRRGSRARLPGASCRCRASRRRTTHVVDPLPERVRLVDAPGELCGVELDVLGWRTEAGETAVICRLVDGSAGTIPARWTDLPWRVDPEAAVGGLGSSAAWRLLLERAEGLR